MSLYNEGMTLYIQGMTYIYIYRTYPSRKLTYPTLQQRKSSTQQCQTVGDILVSKGVESITWAKKEHNTGASHS